MKLFKQKETYISDQVKFCGDIESDSDISLDGRMSGNIVAKKNVMLGATAFFEGNIECESAMICGSFKGTVVARRLIEVKIPAQIVGDLISDSVRVDSGVAIQGKICAKSVQTDSISQIPQTTASRRGAEDEVYACDGECSGVPEKE